MAESQNQEAIPKQKGSSNIPEQNLNSRTSQVTEHRLEIKQHHAPIVFPKFSGEDFSDWKYKCNEFFEMYEDLPDHAKVRLASIHMEGDALHWHQKFTEKKKHFELTWEEYIKKMDKRFGSQSIKTAPSPSKDSARPGEIEKVERRNKIRKREIIEIDDDRIPQFDINYLRFGLMYYSVQEQDVSLKDRAWETVLERSQDPQELTEEIYFSAVRKIEKEAKNCYPEGVADSFTGTQFRKMMITDGCFFLQLVLYILGAGSEELGYTDPDHPVFKQKISNLRFKDSEEWIKAMFFVGNQIPFVVVQELIKQDYFQKVIRKRRKWEEPKAKADISKRVLYELVLLPVLEAQSSWVCRHFRRFWRKIFLSRTVWMQQQKPIDLLHGFQLLILGPERRQNTEEEEEKNIGFEDYYLDVLDNIESPPATELSEAGIEFWNCQRSILRDPFWTCCCIGSRRICFFDKMVCFCYGCAVLCLPPILMADDAELMFQCLRDYEVSQRDMREKECCSYIRFMSELMKTTKDAKVMHLNRVIQGNRKQKHRLPKILKEVATKDAYDHNIRQVKVRITDYSQPVWMKYWKILSFGFFLSVLQAVYNIAKFYKKPKLG